MLRETLPAKLDATSVVHPYKSERLPSLGLYLTTANQPRGNPGSYCCSVGHTCHAQGDALVCALEGLKVIYLILIYLICLIYLPLSLQKNSKFSVC